MIPAYWIAVFPLVTTPWWIWAVVILAMLAVLGVSILISSHGGSETPPAQPPETTPHPAEPPEPEVHVAPRTAEIDSEHMEIHPIEGEIHTGSNFEELTEPEMTIEPGPPPAILALGPDQDDLKLVRGISPSTAAVLHQAGIQTFAQLAGTNIDDLERILRAAGMRTLDPSSWPGQAQLAADGNWVALNAYQNQLKDKK